jgi:glutaconyl-CoA/methylmalonyl-CoA decarboxylase subunit gamma
MRVHVTVQDKTYDVKIDDLLSRPIQVEVDGQIFEVWPEEPKESLNYQKSTIEPQTEKSTQTDDSGKLEESNFPKSYIVKAPIPGVIIEIKVYPGDVVEYGQELCVLEAMKMKNSIRAGKSGTIDKILITTGEQVKQSQILMEFRDEVLP